MSETQTVTTEETQAPPTEEIKLTRADLDRLLEQERGKVARHYSKAAELTAQERDRLKALEAEAAERAKAEEQRKQKEALERADFEKARELIIKSAQDEVISKYEPELQKERERAERYRTKIQDSLRDKIKAAAAPWAYNAEQVVALVEGRRVKLNDDFEVEVYDAAGQPALVGG
jgi:Zn-finger nucleic acid-binding protein